METDLTDEDIESTRAKGRRSFSEQHRNSLLPLQWRLKHRSRWMTHVMASEFSLVAFLLLLIMVFSRKWLYPSRTRFHQRCPQNVSNTIHTSIHTMSTGLLPICRAGGCWDPQSRKDDFKLWSTHPVFGVAKISFMLALCLGLVLTIWLHLPYLPCMQRLPAFGLTGTILSFCEVVFIFFTLMLFPINLWLFELKRNVSVPIGWGYFIGWLAFVLYVTCAVLCYFNHKTFWRLILKSSSSSVAAAAAFCCSTNSCPAQEPRSHPAVPSGGQEGIVGAEQDTKT